MAEPTPTQLRLLRDVGDGEVWQHSDGHSVVSIYGIDSGGGGTLRRVTARVVGLEAAGWAQVVELRYGRQWQLTDAGREVLRVGTGREGS